MCHISSPPAIHHVAMWEMSGMVVELVVLAVVGCYSVVVVDGSSRCVAS